MKKFFIVFILMILTSIGIYADEKKAVILPKGSIIRVSFNDVISTMTNQEGDLVYFVNPVDVWLGEENVLPKDIVFEGYINFLKLPVQGVNGAIGIKIKKILYQTGEFKDFPATVQYKGNFVIGGDLAPPQSYNYSIHYKKPYGIFHMAQGALQYVPSGHYEFGQHVTLRPHEVLFIVTDSDIEF